MPCLPVYSKIISNLNFYKTATEGSVYESVLLQVLLKERCLRSQSVPADRATNEVLVD